MEETRFLGLIFDKRLTWVPHLRYIKAACIRAMRLLRVLSHTSWGADRKTLLMLYKSLILSKLDYGCEVYSSATDARLRVINAVHHAGIRLATGAFRTSPIPSLLVDADVPPLHMHRQSLMVRCWFRLHRLPDSVSCNLATQDSRTASYESRPSLPKPFGYRVRSVMSGLSIPCLPVCPHKVPRVGPWLLPRVRFCKSIPGGKGSLTSQESLAYFLEHSVTHEGSVPVYTDGSKTDTGVGFGVVFPSLNRGGTLSNIASVFTAELTAILLARDNFHSPSTFFYSF